MPDEKQPTDLDENLARWENRLASGEPVQSFYFDGHISISATEEGGIAMDCPCLHIQGVDRLGVVRVVVSPALAGNLLRALQELEKIRDEPFQEEKSHGPQ